MNAAALAIFVKTPGYSPIKTRLAASTGQKAAEEIYRLSVAAVEQTARAASKLLPDLTPLWAIAEEPALRDRMWTGFETIEQGNGGLGSRLSNVYLTLLERFRCVLLIGADSPQLLPTRLVEAAKILLDSHEPRFVLGPAADGGFYLFGGNTPLHPQVWITVQYSTTATAEQLRSGLMPCGQIHELPPEVDLDDASGLPALQSALLNDRPLPPAQEALLDAIKRNSRASARLKPGLP